MKRKKTDMIRDFADAIDDLKGAEQVVLQRIRDDGRTARAQWYVGQYETVFQVRISNLEVLSLIRHNLRWAERRLRELSGGGPARRQEWNKRTTPVGDRRPWWRRLIG